MPSSVVVFKWGAVLAAAVLWGCAAVPVEPLPALSEGASAELLVYRTPSFVAGGVTAAVGSAGKAFAHLDNADYVVARLAPGDREVFVQARSAKPTLLRLSLRAGARTCVRVAPDFSAQAKAMSAGALTSTGYAFVADTVACPTAAGLAGYKAKEVRYAGSGP